MATSGRRRGAGQATGAPALEGRVAVFGCQQADVPDEVAAKQPGTWSAWSGVCRSNAEVVLLDGEAIAETRHFGAFRRARRVMVRAAPRRSWGRGAVGLVRHLLRRRVAWEGFASLHAGSRVQRWASFRVVTDAPPEPRHFLSAEVGVAGLLTFLADTNVGYVVLRWYENLPELEEGEDLDLLVADEDLPTLRAFLADRVGAIPVDIYTPAGVLGTGFRATTYYPPEHARDMLQRAVPGPSGSRIPAASDAFLSLAYHAVYHKGEASGLPERAGAPAVHVSDHDYAGVLSAMARDLGLRVAITLDDLDEYLHGAGWRPPQPVLTALASENAWLAARLSSSASAPTAGGFGMGDVEQVMAPTAGSEGVEVREPARGQGGPQL